MSNGFDGMAKMFNEAAKANPDLMKGLKETGDTFLDSYPPQLPEVMEKVDQYLDPVSKDFFIMYTRLLKAYASGKDSQFIIDFFCFGADKFEMFAKQSNKPQITKGLLLRGSQLRVIADQNEDMDAESLLKVYNKTIEAWALSDTLEIQHGSFLPVEVSKMLIELQMEAGK